MKNIDFFTHFNHYIHLIYLILNMQNHLTKTTTPVPKFIISSLLYTTLRESSSDPTSLIKVCKYYNKNILHRQPFIINNNEEFIEVLHTLRYWMVNDVPMELFRYIDRCEKDKENIDFKPIKKEFTDYKLIDELIFFHAFINKKILKNRYCSYNTGGKLDYGEFIDVAIGLGYLNCFKYLAEYSDSTIDFDASDVFCCAAANGRLNILKYTIDLRKRIAKLNEEMNKICENFSEADLEKFYDSDEHKCILNEDYVEELTMNNKTLYLASNYGHYECFKICYEELQQRNPTEALKLNDHIYNTSCINCLKFAQSVKNKFPNFSYDVMRKHVFGEGGQYGQYQYKPEWTSVDAKIPFRGINYNDYGDIVYNYRLSSSCFSSDYPLTTDYKKGPSYSNIYEFLELLCVRFAKSIECLQFAFDNGCSKNDIISYSAVFYDCLVKDDSFSRTKFVLKNKCMLNDSCSNIAASFGNVEMLKFIQKNNGPIGDALDTSRYYLDVIFDENSNKYDEVSMDRYYESIKYVKSLNK